MAVTRTHRSRASLRAILPALVAAGMCMATFALLGAPARWSVLVAAASGTFLVYLLDRTWWAGPEDSGRTVGWGWLETLGACIAAFGLGVALPYLRMESVVIATIVAATAVAYAMPRAGRRLKDIAAAKPVVVAAAWAVAAIIIPASEIGATAALPLTLLALYRFAFILPNTLLVDVADRVDDRRAGIMTPSAFFSYARIRDIASVSGVAAISLAAAAVLGGVMSPVLFVDAAGVLVLLALINRPMRPARRATLVDFAMLWPFVTAFAATLTR